MIDHNNRSRFWLFLKTNLLGIALYTIFMVTTLTYVTNKVYTDITSLLRNETLETLKEYEKKGGSDLEVICLITNCYNIRSGERGKLLYTNHYDESRRYLLGLGIKPNKYYIENVEPYELANNVYVYSETLAEMKILKTKHFSYIIILGSIWFIAGISLVIFIRIYIKKYHAVRDRQILEEKLRRRLTESVHHELSGPLSMLKANLKAGFSIMYPCEKYGGCQVNAGVVHDDCKSCPVMDKFVNIEEGSVLWNYTNAMTAIDQMQSVLNIMANAKHIQYTNGSVSIAKILDNLIASKRLTTYNLVKLEVVNRDGLTNIACGNGLNNGQVLNILTSMVNNSIEAEANKITIDWEDNRNGTISLFIHDNGYGVRDLKKRLIKDVKSFQIKYGYSTKISPFDLGDMMKGTMFTNLLGWILLDADDKYVKVRGSGLHLNKTLLEMHGGSLDLYRNSESGATFRVVIPVKQLHFDELEQNVMK